MRQSERHRRKQAMQSLTGVALALTFAPAWACSCSQRTLAQLVDNAQIVLLVRMTHVQVFREKRTPDRVFREVTERGFFNTLEVFKGDPSQVPYVESTYSPELSCVFSFNPGRTYVLYVNPPSLTVSFCRGAQPVVPAEYVHQVDPIRELVRQPKR